MISPRPQKAAGTRTQISKSGGRGDMTREKKGVKIVGKQVSIEGRTGA